MSPNKSNQVTIQNLGNIPSRFCWSILDENLKDFKATFIPKEGIIPAKGSIDMKILFTPYKGGDLSQILVCDFDELDYPLGFEITANVFGLSVIFEKIKQQ